MSSGVTIRSNIQLLTSKRSPQPTFRASYQWQCCPPSHPTATNDVYFWFFILIHERAAPSQRLCCAAGLRPLQRFGSIDSAWLQTREHSFKPARGINPTASRYRITLRISVLSNFVLDAIGEWRSTSYEAPRSDARLHQRLLRIYSLKFTNRRCIV